jgi:hypothetical protein
MPGERSASLTVLTMEKINTDISAWINLFTSHLGTEDIVRALRVRDQFQQPDRLGTEHEGAVVRPANDLALVRQHSPIE